MGPVDRLREAEKQTRIAYEELDAHDQDDRELVQDVGSTAERLRRLIHRLEERGVDGS